MTLLVFLTGLATSSGQSYTLSTANCTATSNVISFDVMVTNTGPGALNLQAATIRLTHATGLVPTTGVNTFTFAYVQDGQSDAPLMWPPTSTVTATYTAAVRQMSVGSGTTAYANNGNGSCNGVAPSLPIGVPKKIGRFSLTISNTLGQGFNPGANVGLTWATTASANMFLNCATTVSLATALTKTLSTPCAMSIPSSCAISASIEGSTQPTCFGGSNGTATASSTGSVGAATYTWSTIPQQVGATASGLAAGTYTVTATDPNTPGCTSTATVTIGQPAQLTTTESISSCDSYFWPVNGQTYTESGTYTATTNDGANGCSVVHTLNLVITTSSSTTTTISACDHYVWSVNGTDYTASGTYTNVVGCHTDVLVLTITPSTSNTTTITACDTYTWSVDGNTYTASGTYTNTVGCHTEILALTINPTPATPVVTVVNNCDATTTLSTSASGSLLWSNGATTSSITVSTAGTYTVTATANGCPSAPGSGVAAPVAVLSASYSAGTIACFGGSTSVTISAADGTPAYVGTGVFTQFAGTAVYSVTDANGCSASVTVTLTQPAKVEGTTTTTASSCAGSDGTATVSATGGNGSYTYLWSNGQTSATATGLAIGTYTVIITDGNGCTGSASATVGGSGGSPATPGAISGPSGACRNSVGIVYSVAPVAGATSYVWSLPGGATGSSTTNSITVAFDNTYAGGFICVAAVNLCGTGLQSCMSIPVIATYASQPAVISGPAVACGPGTYTYSTTSANALSYIWTVTGTGVSIVSGQGTNTVQVSVPAGFGQGSIQVRGSNCYGLSPVRGMTITGIPTHSNAVSGPQFVCANNTATYTMPVVPGASTYTWSITGGATLVTSGQTSTTTSATFAMGPSWTSGTVTITVGNGCGTYSRSFVVNSVPTQPGSISGPGFANCGTSNVTYSIAAVAGATSYSWTVPAGVSIVTNSGLSITVNFTGAFTTQGNICVTANNSCGSGVARCYTVTSRPAPPVVTGPTAVCKSQSAVTYSLTPVSGATSYSWSVTGGASIAPSGTSAIVNYNTALSSSAIVRANALNACGASSPGGVTVNVSLFCRDAQDAVATATELTAFPNPTNGKATVAFTAGAKAKYVVKVTDLLGNVIVSDVITAVEGYNTQEIDMSQVAKGLYMVSLTAEDGQSQTLRLVVE